MHENFSAARFTALAWLLLRWIACYSHLHHQTEFSLCLVFPLFSLEYRIRRASVVPLKHKGSTFFLLTFLFLPSVRHIVFFHYFFLFIYLFWPLVNLSFYSFPRPRLQRLALSGRRNPAVVCFSSFIPLLSFFDNITASPATRIEYIPYWLLYSSIYSSARRGLKIRKPLILVTKLSSSDRVAFSTSLLKIEVDLFARKYDEYQISEAEAVLCFLIFLLASVCRRRAFSSRHGCGRPQHYSKPVEKVERAYFK